jgi:hypothetical protein
MFRHVCCIVFASLIVVPGVATAASTAAVGDGDWSNVATWTNGAPGSSDNVYVGTNSVPGGAPAAAVALSQASSAFLLSLGYTGGLLGTVDLNGHTLNAHDVYLGNSDSVRRTGGGRLNVTNQLNVQADSFAFAPTDITWMLSVAGGASVTTADASNVTTALTVASGGRLTLGADLTTTSRVDVGGTFNGNGRTIRGSVYFGVSAGPVSIVNRGPIIGDVTISSFYTPGLTTFGLTNADTVGTLTLDGVSTTLTPDVSVKGLNVYSTPAARGTATTTSPKNITAAVDIGTDATLTLGADLAAEVTVRGTLDFQGHAINTTHGVGFYGGPSFALQNRGPITTNSMSVEADQTRARCRSTSRPATTSTRSASAAWPRSSRPR